MIKTCFQSFYLEDVGTGTMQQFQTTKTSLPLERKYELVSKKKKKGRKYEHQVTRMMTIAVTEKHVDKVYTLRAGLALELFR